MRFLVDNQLPPALARFLSSELGCEAQHVADIGLRDASDAEVWRYAAERGMVVVSKDEDFAHMAMRGSNRKLLWVRLGNCRRNFLLDRFRKLWPGISERLESGDRFIEIR